MPTPPAPTFAENLLAWFARGHRPMPWRTNTSPYSIWLAEVMLQQTTVATVIPYHTRFLQRFPTLHSLAAADIQEVLTLWQGLGYYRRAHQLHACAQVLVAEHNATFPQSEEALLRLPGIGPYTAAVIAATAFNVPAAVVDGNVERVLSRQMALELPLPAAKNLIRQEAARRMSHQHPAAYANAIMELGATVCTPKNPSCTTCPVAATCQALALGSPTAYPVKAPKKKIPHLTATALLLTDAQGHIYLRQRPASGLLASLWELPHAGWEETSPRLPHLAHSTPQKAGHITHTFSHFKLTLNLLTATTQAPLPPAHAFTLNNLPPLSTLMAKALKKALAAPR